MPARTRTRPRRSGRVSAPPHPPTYVGAGPGTRRTPHRRSTMLRCGVGDAPCRRCAVRARRPGPPIRWDRSSRSSRDASTAWLMRPGSNRWITSRPASSSSRASSTSRRRITSSDPAGETPRCVARMTTSRSVESATRTANGWAGSSATHRRAARRQRRAERIWVHSASSRDEKHDVRRVAVRDGVVRG